MRTLTTLAILLVWASSAVAEKQPEVLGQVLSTADYGPVSMWRTSDGIFFGKGNIGDESWQLWFSDGTKAGTCVILESPRDDKRDFPVSYFQLDARTHFVTHSVNGFECWATDGTKQGTTRRFALPGIKYRSGPLGAAVMGNRLYFAGEDSQHGEELWHTDGTKDGTAIVRDVRPGAEGCSIGSLEKMDNYVYFKADDGKRGTEIWRSDGTNDGTTLVADITEGPAGTQFGRIDVRAGKLFAWVWNKEASFHELWVSDGTGVGTRRIKGLTDHSRYPDWPYELQGKMILTIDDGKHGTEYWVSDGSEEGTFLLADLTPGERGSTPSIVYVAHGFLYFVLKTDVNAQDELWRTDGTKDGTTRVGGPDKGQRRYYELRGVDGDSLILQMWQDNCLSIWRISGKDAAPELVCSNIQQGERQFPWGPSTAVLNGKLLFFDSVHDLKSPVQLWALDLRK